jgi:hypothetical protein
MKAIIVSHNLIFTVIVIFICIPFIYPENEINVVRAPSISLCLELGITVPLFVFSFIFQSL